MNKTLKLWLVFLIILIGGLLYLNFFVIGKKVQTTKQTPKEETVFVEQPTPNPTLTILEPTIAEVLNKGGQIPFDYEVVGVSEGMITVEGLKGRMALSNKPSNRVFWKKGEEVQETEFSSLKVGQKLVLEIGTGATREIKIYIVQDSTP